ncbi:MAG: HAMP domain-containing histidine kinase [Acidobacteria bacterium]|nr:HAMP domain-containing histidine kinase [Acidobacteriota bacterium]
MTLRVRIAVALAVLAGIAAVFVAATTYVTTDQRVRAEVDSYLDTYGRRFQDRDGRDAAALCGRRGPGPAELGDQQRNDDGVSGVAFQCISPAGTVVATVGPVALPVDPVDRVMAAGRGGVRTRTVSTDSGTFRVQTVALAGGGAVQIARDYGETQRVLGGLRWWLLLIVALTVSVAAAAGWFIARRATEPLVQLTDAAEEVATTGRLDVAIPVTGDDEPGRLARAFATMLNALGRSREQQQQLVQDAGHELRTPLTSLRTNVETLQRYDALPADTRRSILGDLEAETRELGALVDELVQLATDTYDDEPEQRVALDQLVERSAERVRRRTGRVISVTSNPGFVVGRPRDLARAIGNLLENAAKFSPATEPIEVSVSGGVVSVRDHGPGVPEEDRAHIFERFYRSAAARALPGSGLGLAIVDQTARTHGGSVSVAEAIGGGAIFTLSIPPAP